MSTPLPFWYHFLPLRIKSLFVGRDTFQKASNTLVWLTLENVLIMGMGFVVNVLLARSLGPSQYGYFNYLMAFITIFVPISKLGLGSVLVKQLSQSQQKATTLLGTSFILKLIGASLTVLIAGITMSVLRPHDSQSQLLILLLSSMTFFQAFEVIDFFFQSKLKMQFLVIVKIAFTFISVGLKVWALLRGLGVSQIAFLWCFEQLLIALGFLLVYQTKRSLFDWRFDLGVAQTMLRQSLPLMFSSLIIMGYAQTDQLFLNYFKGSAELGQYAVALIFINGLALLPVIIQKVAAPLVLKINKTEQHQRYRDQFTQLYRIMLWLSLAVSLITMVIAKPTITLFYGQEYAVAGTILSILHFRFFFAAFGTVRTIYVVSENMFDFDLLTNALGLIVSVTGSILLIPSLGVYGLMVASFLALFVSTFAVDFFHPKMRQNLTMVATALLTPHHLLKLLS